MKSRPWRAAFLQPCNRTNVFKEGLYENPGAAQAPVGQLLHPASPGRREHLRDGLQPHCLHPGGPGHECRIPCREACQGRPGGPYPDGGHRLLHCPAQQHPFPADDLVLPEHPEAPLPDHHAPSAGPDRRRGMAGHRQHGGGPVRPQNAENGLCFRSGRGGESSTGLPKSPKRLLCPRRSLFSRRSRSGFLWRP